MPAEDTSTDYVFRIIYPGHKHDNSKCLCSALFKNKKQTHTAKKTCLGDSSNGKIYHKVILTDNCDLQVQLTVGLLNKVKLVIFKEMEWRWEMLHLLCVLQRKYSKYSPGLAN